MGGSTPTHLTKLSVKEKDMANTIYYTYVLVFLLTRQRYYGVRTAKGGTTDDLWTSYFTSSKVVKALIKEHGKEAFTTEIRKIFDTPEAALAWEHRVLCRLHVSTNDNWLNKSEHQTLPALSGSNNPMYGKKHRPDSIQKMKDVKYERNKTRPRKVLSELHKENIRKALIGHIVLPETRKKLREKNSGENNGRFGQHHTPKTKSQISKSHEKHSYVVIFPDRKIGEITNVMKFAKTYNLNPGALYAVINGKRNHHKGFVISRKLLNDKYQ